MSARSSRPALVALVAGAALTAGVATASATSPPPPTLTPAGPAAIQGFSLQPMAGVGLPPAVVVGWTVDVGPGGKAGTVRLMNQDWDGARPVFRGGAPAVQLPAEPGRYTFAIPAGQGLRASDGYPNPVLVQETGEHAVLDALTPDPQAGPWADPAQVLGVSIFTPPPADGATAVPAAQRIMARRLRVSVVKELDVDQDGLGDETQDVGDLKLLSARVVRRDGRYVEIAARVRNVGTTKRDRVGLETAPGPFCWLGCRTSLAPGAEAEVTANVLAPGSDPALVRVVSEGKDTNPADDALAPAPIVALGTTDGGAASRAGGLRVRVGLSHAGTVKLSARAAGLGFGRTLSFSKAARKTILLAPRRAADRRRLARALRRPGALAALVVADAGSGATQVLRLKA